MATLTITLPDPTSEWIERQAKTGGYASISAYLRDLVERERASDTEMDWPEQPELTIEDLRRMIDESRASGPSGKSVHDIFKEAKEIAISRGILRD